MIRLSRHTTNNIITTTTAANGSRRSILNTIWYCYNQNLKERPLMTKVCMASLIFFTSDCITQYIQQQQHTKDTCSTGTSTSHSGNNGNDHISFNEEQLPIAPSISFYRFVTSSSPTTISSSSSSSYNNQHNNTDTTNSSSHTWNISRSIAAANFGILSTTFLHYWWNFLDTNVNLLFHHYYSTKPTNTPTSTTTINTTPFAITNNSRRIATTTLTTRVKNITTSATSRILPFVVKPILPTVMKVMIHQTCVAPIYIYTYYVTTNFVLQCLTTIQHDQHPQHHQPPPLLHFDQQQNTITSKQQYNNIKEMYTTIQHIWYNVNEKAYSMWYPTMIRHWSIWPMIQSINFYFIPLQHRILFHNTILMFWSGYLSYLNHHHHHHEHHHNNHPQQQRVEPCLCPTTATTTNTTTVTTTTTDTYIHKNNRSLESL
jgi:hypothetical protein